MKLIAEWNKKTSFVTRYLKCLKGNSLNFKLIAIFESVLVIKCCCCDVTFYTIHIFVRSIENIFRMQRTLCSLLRPSLELLSGSVSVDTALGETTKKKLNTKAGLTVEYRDSIIHRLDTLDSASAKRALSQLKQLTSMLCLCVCYLLARNNHHFVAIIQVSVLH